jgi:hypothetical protein
VLGVGAARHEKEDPAVDRRAALAGALESALRVFVICDTTAPFEPNLKPVCGPAPNDTDTGGFRIW